MFVLEKIEEKLFTFNFRRKINIIIGNENTFPPRFFIYQTTIKEKKKRKQFHENIFSQPYIKKLKPQPNIYLI